MPPASGLAAALADVVVVALTIAAIGCLGLAMWLIVAVVLRVHARMQPPRRPARPARVTAVLGQDGRDSGETIITRD